MDVVFAWHQGLLTTVSICAPWKKWFCHLSYPWNDFPTPLWNEDLQVMDFWWMSRSHTWDFWHQVVRRVSTACSMWIMMIIDFAFRKIMWESDNVLHVRSLWSVLGKGGWCNISIVPIRNHNMLSSQSTRKLIIWHKPTWTACQEFSMNCSFVWRDLVDLSKCRGVRKNITENPHVMGKNRFPANFSVNKSSDKWFTSIGYFSPDANVSLTSGIFDEVKSSLGTIGMNAAWWCFIVSW